MAERPLVSVLIPTHKRPELLRLAVESAQAQSYREIEILVSDNSDDSRSEQLIAALREQDPRIRYLRQEGGGYMENWLNALHAARGEFVNYLMDDDLFYPRKIEVSVAHFLADPRISVVTSFRQLIDAEGRPMAPLRGTERLFPQDTLIEGRSLQEHLLRQGANLIGEPTTAMVRRAELGERIGLYCGWQYEVLADLSTWMALLPGRYCAYLTEAHSAFRIHGGQDQRRSHIGLLANIEWLRLLIDGHAAGHVFEDRKAFRELLAVKFGTLVHHLAAKHEAVREAKLDIPALQALMQRASDALFLPDETST